MIHGGFLLEELLELSLHLEEEDGKLKKNEKHDKREEDLASKWIDARDGRGLVESWTRYGRVYSPKDSLLQIVRLVLIDPN